MSQLSDWTNMKTPGRVNLEADNATNVQRLPGFQYETQGSFTAGQDGIRGNWEPNTLNQTFFSQENFQIVQNKIRFEVYQKTGEIIDQQSADDLFMIMRAMYLQWGKNLPYNIAQQITELNERVADWCVPKIVAELHMFKQYQKDIANMPVPLAHPVNISAAGTRSAPFKPPFSEDYVLNTTRK
jgi:hypothetical protein